MLASDELRSPLRDPFPAFVAYFLISVSCFPQFAGVRFLKTAIPTNNPGFRKPVSEPVWFVLPQQRVVLDELDESNVGHSLSFPTVTTDNLAGVSYAPHSSLDQNQDGSAMDDLQRMAANFFK